MANRVTKQALRTSGLFRPTHFKLYTAKSDVENNITGVKMYPHQTTALSKPCLFTYIGLKCSNRDGIHANLSILHGAVQSVDRGRKLCFKNTSCWIPKVTHVIYDISNAQCNNCFYVIFKICDTNTDHKRQTTIEAPISSAFRRYHSPVQRHKSPRKRFVCPAWHWW